MGVHLKLVYEVLKQIALNWNMRSHTKARIAKIIFCALLRYYAAQSGNSLPTFQDNLLVPSSGVKKSKREKTAWLKFT